jgi:ubiquinone/menaquinone biosynthesis C-methylase UbiE
LATLEASGHSVFGLDISPYMGKLAQKRTAALLVRGRAQELPFCPDAFDSVVSTFPTEFIFSRESLAARHRVLKPGGLLVVLPEGHLTGNSPLHRFIEWLYKITGQSEGVFALDLGQQAVNVPPWQLVQELFIAAGFQARLEHHQLAKSAVTIVLACKAG